jgi:hypothetical protein
MYKCLGDDKLESYLCTLSEKMKTNIIHQIEMKRVRYNHNEGFALIQQLKDYESMLQNDTSKGTFDYQHYHSIPVAICSVFESFFRAAIKDLIDLNIAKNKRLIKINGIRNFRFNFSFWNEIKEKEISLGEVVSILVKIKKIKSINALLSILLDLDFLPALKSFTYSSKSTLEAEEYWTNNYNQILRDIDSIYELRNILCPEFGFWVEVKKETLFRYLKHSILFLEQVNRYLYRLHNPLQKKSRKIKEETIAKRSFIESEKELDQLIAKISKVSDELGYDIGPFEEAFTKEIILWKQYRKKLARSNCEMYIGTENFWPVYWRNMEFITREKIDSLLKLNESLFFEAEIHSKVQKFD